MRFQRKVIFGILWFRETVKAYLLQVVIGEPEMEGVEDGGGNFNELTLVRGLLLEQVDVVPVWGRGSSDLQKLAKHKNLASGVDGGSEL
jgi:hypothetical protein